MPTRPVQLSRSQRYTLFLLPLTAVILYGIFRSIPGGLATNAASPPFPDPPLVAATAAPSAPAISEQTAVLAGGCFWGMEAIFQHLKGVSRVESGFSGGTAATAHYERVSGGGTDHAEAVKITYDPAQISYGQLLKVYFSVAHDPTQLNRQGPDTGPQYRSEIFFADQQQRQLAQDYIERLNQANVFQQPIVTQIAPLQQFYPAEPYHQDFIEHHPDYPYVVVHDLPKLEQLREWFPDLYRQ
ncbi:MAG: peptide-methionine (S)-S-oxide reductase MsrA [Elainella sp.]